MLLKTTKLKYTEFIQIHTKTKQKPTEKMLHSIHHVIHGTEFGFCPSYSSYQVPTAKDLIVC